MDFPLTADIAYIVLVVGFLLAVFALLSPGTGVFEIGALFAFVIAGWAVYTLPINLWALAVLLLGVFPFLIALRRTENRIYLAISALALVIGSAYLFQGPVWWQPGVNLALVAVVSVGAGGLLWVMATKILEASSFVLSHDLAPIVGSTGEARSEIHKEGSVYVRGEMWTARSEEPIQEGTRVRVTGRNGLILNVEPLEEDDD